MDSESLLFFGEIVLALLVLVARVLSSEKRRFQMKDKIENKLHAMNLPKAAHRFDVICKNTPKMMGANTDALYGCLVVVVCGVCMLMPYFANVDSVDFLLYISMAAESFGLIMLRYKIRSSGSVSGVSGQTLCIITIEYIFRATNVPSFRSKAFCLWGLKMLDIISLVLILDVLECIFFTYRKTYQKDVDHFKAVYVILGAACLAIAYHPSSLNKRHPFRKHLEMYLDTFSLLPQIVMMVCQSEYVQAPIAHFVAGTSISRISDLFYWCHKYSFWTHPLNMTLSMWVVIACHATQFFLVADFLYLYGKTYVTKGNLSADIIIDEV